MSRNFKPDRNYYIPSNAKEIKDEKSTAVAYVKDMTDNPTRHGKSHPFLMVAFQGRAQKPALNYVYPTEESRDKRMADFFESIRESERLKRERAERRKNAPVGLDVGDILESSWGWEQTNIDYYQVVGVKGRYVTLREIARRSVETLYMQGDCWPIPDKFIGEPFKKQAREGTVKLSSYKWASKIEPTLNEDGEKVYKKSHWTAYA